MAKKTDKLLTGLLLLGVGGWFLHSMGKADEYTKKAEEASKKAADLRLEAARLRGQAEAYREAADAEKK